MEWHDWISIFTPIVSIFGAYLIASFTSRSAKTRKYEEELVRNRVAKCSELLQIAANLTDHLNPVAKGIKTLRSDIDRKELEQTFAHLETIYKFTAGNSLFLGEQVILAVIYFQAGFLELHNAVDLDSKSDKFYALCRWTWGFESGLATAVKSTLADADFTIPLAIDIQAARSRGFDECRKLIDLCVSDRVDMGIDARNKEILEHAKQLDLPFEKALEWRRTNLPAKP